MLVVFESTMKSQNKGRFHNAQNTLLVQNMALLTILYNPVFLDAFEGVRSVLDALHLDQLDEAESACAEGLDDCKTFKLGINQRIVGLSNRFFYFLFFDFFLALVANTANKGDKSFAIESITFDFSLGPSIGIALILLDKGLFAKRVTGS